MNSRVRRPGCVTSAQMVLGTLPSTPANSWIASCATARNERSRCDGCGSPQLAQKTSTSVLPQFGQRAWVDSAAAVSFGGGTMLAAMRGSVDQHQRVLDHAPQGTVELGAHGAVHRAMVAAHRHAQLLLDHELTVDDLDFVFGGADRKDADLRRVDDRRELVD